MCAKAIQTPIPRVGLGVHYIGQEEIDAVTNLLRQPEKLFRFRGKEKTECDLLETELCVQTGAKYALFVNSGTAALSCCLAGLRIGPGDEVIVPAYTYIATASAVINVGAVPVLADIDNSLGLDPLDVERKITPYTKAIIAVHMQGVPCRMRQLRQLAKKHNIKIIEDCCQAVGARYDGVYCGLESDAFAWSSNFYKVITCGEGGVFFANDKTTFQTGLYQADPAMKMWMTNFDLDPSIKPFVRAGYRASEISACILRVQLTRLESILAKVRANHKILMSHLNEGIHYQLQHVDDPAGNACFSFGMIAHTAELARKLVAEAEDEGLILDSSYTGAFPDRHVFVHWDAILDQFGATELGYPWRDPAYKGQVKYSHEMCPNTMAILPRVLKLPINAEMTEQNMVEIAEAINKVDARL